MTRLNVVSGGEDTFIDAVRNRLDAFENVFCHEGLVTVLHAHCQNGNRAELLDVIGHSRGEGFLVLGNWTIDDSPQTAATFAVLLRPYLQQLGVRTIRLLGCSTAVTERARAALRRIARATRCHVVGAKRLIGNRDYTSLGFNSDHILIDGEGIAFNSLNDAAET